jgi:hypothetical protein
MFDELHVSSSSAPDGAGGVCFGGADAPPPADGPTHHGPPDDGAADAAPDRAGPRAPKAGAAAAPLAAVPDFVPKAEFDKVVAQRQAAKERARQLAAVARDLAERLKAGGGAVAAGPSNAGIPARDPGSVRAGAGSAGRNARVTPDMSATDADASADADDAEFLDLEAIHGRLREPLQRRLAALQAENAAARRRLMELLRDQELRTAAARAGAINPDQVVVLLRDRVAMDDADAGPDGPAGNSGTSARDGLPPNSAGADAPAGSGRFAGVRQLVERFLCQDENANLVGCSVAAGSGARQAGGPGVHVDNLPRTRAEFLALPAEQRTAAAHRMTRQQRDELLGRNAPRGGGYL